MARQTITVELHFAWWFRLYLLGVVMMARITGLQSDPRRVGWWLNKAVTIEVQGRYLGSACSLVRHRRTDQRTL